MRFIAKQAEDTSLRDSRDLVEVRQRSSASADRVPLVPVVAREIDYRMLDELLPRLCLPPPEQEQLSETIDQPLSYPCRLLHLTDLFSRARIDHRKCSSMTRLTPLVIDEDLRIDNVDCHLDKGAEGREMFVDRSFQQVSSTPPSR